MAKQRKIAVLTGKRGGFGALIPFFQQAEKDPDVTLTVIATDMHLSDAFGKTIREVKQWVSNVVAVPMDQQDSRPVSRAAALGQALTGMAQALHQVAPDVLVVLGDRGETLATATAATHLGIPLAHIQGGDVSGNVDEAMRHAITKLSHIHFPATEESAQRIRAMGEEPWRVHVVGDPHVDRIVSREFTPSAEVRKRYGIAPDEGFLLVLFHPETLGDPEMSGSKMRTLMDTVIALCLRTLVVYPCSDHGYKGIVDVIESLDVPRVSVHKNIEAVDFWGLQAEATALIGNSSAGLIEAPYAHLPVVNVGSRQEGRARWRNVIDARIEPVDLTRALQKVIDPAFRASLVTDKSPRPFGDGDACRKMLQVLKTVAIDDRLINKRITY
ncbi:MAG TPA: UDP-N-acetylglucosamine 2-epimerase [Burkholderiales bacterium]|nr:UDP-N-acetylglucosamine 2-epimerase [Burkholderiales bacterium]